MAQFTIQDLRDRAGRLGIRRVAGPVDARAVTRVDVVPLDRLSGVPAGTLAIVPGEENTALYRFDVAVRQASARSLAGIVFASDLALGETALALAERGGVPLFVASEVKASDLALGIDRLLAGGAADAMIRAAQAVERATAIASGPDGTLEGILAEAGQALGLELRIVEDAGVAWSALDAVCIGEVPIGRLVAEDPDGAASVALPAIVSLLSRVAQRAMRDRYAPTKSRSDLIVELVLAESSRVEAFVAPAARLGFPMQQSHVVAWLKPTGLTDAEALAPRTVLPALELFALQLVDGRDETWHVAFLRDELLLVGTEAPGAVDHQRRVREVAVRIQRQAALLAGPGWAYTVGLGTPQIGAGGLRLSSAEARVAAESAIAAGRLGGIELTDVTGLRRVLLDLFASPVSRGLLDDVLQPLDALGPERAQEQIRTLLAYVSNRNSLAHAGAELSLHPNGVAYRLRRIRDLLHLDLDHPDTRFAVELACRVRLLGATRR